MASIERVEKIVFSNQEWAAWKIVQDALKEILRDIENTEINQVVSNLDSLLEDLMEYVNN